MKTSDLLDEAGRVSSSAADGQAALWAPLVVCPLALALLAAFSACLRSWVLAAAMIPVFWVLARRALALLLALVCSTAVRLVELGREEGGSNEA